MTRAQMLQCVTVGLAVCCLFATLVPAQEDGGDELVTLVVSLLSNAEKEMRALGLEQVRTEASGPSATRQFAAQLPKLPPEVQVELLRALAVRNDKAARPAVLELLNASQDAPVRVAAIGALVFLGEPSDAQQLLSLLTQGTPVERTAAQAALTRLPGEAVSTSIAAAIEPADSAERVTLIGILQARRASGTASAILPLAVAADPSVRVATNAALGELAGPEHIPGMVRGILAAERGREREAAEKAIMFVCQRIGENQDQAEPLLAAMDGLDAADRAIVLPALGRVGGPAALKLTERALADSDRQTHEAGLRALCNWSDASVAPQLIKLAQSDEHSGDRITALRALIRVAPLPDGRSEVEKLDLLKTALDLCTRDTERHLALQRAAAIRIPETLRFLVPYLDQPPYAQQACQSIVELAHHRDLREPNKSEFDAALDQVIAVSTDDTVIDRAKRYKRGETWVRPS